MSGMFSKWFGRKSATSSNHNTDVYITNFQAYGFIGELGGFESHCNRIASDIMLPISDDKYRKDNRNNALGPIYANRSLRGHIHPVISTFWSTTDPTLLISVGKDSRLLTWDISDASKTAQYQVSGDLLMSCSVNSSNQLIALGGLSNKCCILKRNRETGALTNSGVSFDEHEGFIAACPFVSDTQVLTGSGDYTCKLFDISNPSAALKTFQHDNEVMSIAPCLLPDHSAQVFYTASGGVLSLWDTREPNTDKASLAFCVLSGTDISSIDVCKTKDHIVACGTESGDCYVYDTRGGAGRCTVVCVDRDITQEVASVALSYSGNLLFAGYRSWVKRYMDCVMIAFDLQNAQWETEMSRNPAAAVAETETETAHSAVQSGTEPIIAPHCVIGGNPAITSSIPFSYSAQNCSGTFMSSVRLNCDGCALSAASHDGTITVFRQQR